MGFWERRLSSSLRAKKPKHSNVAGCVALMLLMCGTTCFGQLVVNRASGDISLMGLSAAVNGYEISSANGLLAPEGWSSLQDQSVEGWNEANPRPEMLTELNPFSSSDPGASPFNLGTAYTGTTVPPANEDLALKYSLADGTVVDGTVSYEGPINDFVLRVDPASGATNFELLSANIGTFDVVGYTIFSDSGSLAPANIAGMGADWTTGKSSENSISELNLSGSMGFTANTTAPLGNIFTPGAEQDLRFEFATSGFDILKGTVTYGEGGVVTPICDPNSQGDLNGDGQVGFPDFLVLSANFGATDATSHTVGDINCDGSVGFPDFLVLSANFGSTVGAQAAAPVPEPTSGLMAAFAALVLVGAGRRRIRSGAFVAMVGMLALFAFESKPVMALDFNTRMIVLDPENPGANNQINSALEARGILNGSITDVNILEDVTGTVDFIDFAGGAGAFPTNYPYPNGVNDESLNDFTVHVSGFLEIPAGEWYIGFNSDDGGVINMPRVDFLTTVNENGATGVKGELIYNGTRGQGTWTGGNFMVPAGGIRTEFDAIMFERGGGDSLEVAVISGEELGDFELINEDWLDFGFELGDGVFDWKLIENGPATGDFNWDDAVDFADFLTLANNYGTGSSFAQGDINGDALVDLADFNALLPLLTAPAGAAPVPEPGSISLFLAGFLGLLALRRTRS